MRFHISQTVNIARAQLVCVSHIHVCRTINFELIHREIKYLSKREVKIRPLRETSESGQTAFIHILRPSLGPPSQGNCERHREILQWSHGDSTNRSRLCLPRTISFVRRYVLIYRIKIAQIKRNFSENFSRGQLWKCHIKH